MPNDYFAKRGENRSNYQKNDSNIGKAFRAHKANNGYFEASSEIDELANQKTHILEKVAKTITSYVTQADGGYVDPGAISGDIESLLKQACLSAEEREKVLINVVALLAANM